MTALDQLRTLFNSIPSFVFVILHGQLISLLIAGTGVFASILSNFHPSANFPLFMNLFNYLLLSFFLIRYHYHKSHEEPQIEEIFEIEGLSDLEITTSSTSPSSVNNKKKEKLQISNWIYLFAAILDVEANFLVLLAYNYTTITSVMLLDCFTIPCAMILSYIFLGCRYSTKHYIGTVVCLLGLICIVVNDVFYGEASSSKNALLGDIFCLVGAMLYACSNVVQETLVKFHSRDQFLGSLGIFGTFIALGQCLLFDLKGLQEADFTIYVIASMIGFIVCLFFMYVNTTSYLQKSDAILFNLSLLTSDVYAVIFTYFFYGYLVGWLYFIAFGLVICGLYIYHTEKPPLQLGKENGASSAHPMFLSYCLRKDSSGIDNRKLRMNNTFEYNPINDDSTHAGGGRDGSYD